MTDLERLAETLAADGRPRVWSILVTFLGDVGEPAGGAVEMQTLLTACRAMGLEEQAVRTAMSRLVKDGLVDSIRTGRTARYSFTDTARAEYRAAAPVVYAVPRSVGSWRCAVLPPGPGDLLDRLAPTYPVVFGQNLAVWPTGDARARRAEEIAGKDVMWFTSLLSDLPAWAHEAMAPEVNLTLARALSETLARTGWRPPDDPWDALALRVLSVHFWRRIVLRFPPATAPLAASDWPMAAAHRALADRYRALCMASAPVTGGPDRIAGRF